MSALLTPHAPPEVCGTFQAAQLLGLSVGTVQAMVERGELKAWKTKGGHRRIYMDSVRNFQRANGFKVSSAPTAASLKMLVVDDDPVFLATVKEVSATWHANINCVVMSSAIEALMNISTLAPTVLLTDLHMPKVDGFELVKQVRSNEQLASMRIIAVTGMEPSQIKQHESLPPGVLLMKKPLDMRWLDGYVSALGTMVKD